VKLAGGKPAGDTAEVWPRHSKKQEVLQMNAGTNSQESSKGEGREADCKQTPDPQESQESTPVTVLQNNTEEVNGAILQRLIAIAEDELNANVEADGVTTKLESILFSVGNIRMIMLNDHLSLDRKVSTLALCIAEVKNSIGMAINYESEDIHILAGDSSDLITKQIAKIKATRNEILTQH
jgi:hypothetical protein